jgi:hypothetical protein
MSDMVRKQIYLEQRQGVAVQQKAAILGVNESEVIRRAIDRDLYGSGGSPSNADPTAWDEIETFLASVADTPQKGEPYQFNREELHNEWLRRFDEPDSD